MTIRSSDTLLGIVTVFMNQMLFQNIPHDLADWTDGPKKLWVFGVLSNIRFCFRQAQIADRPDFRVTLFDDM